MESNGDIPYWATSDGQQYQRQKELYQQVMADANNIFGRRVFDGIARIPGRPTLFTILRACGIRSPRWSALFNTKKRSMPVEPDIIARLAVLLHDNPVWLYSESLALLSPSIGGLVLRQEWEKPARPETEEINEFFKVRAGRASELYAHAQEQKNNFALMVMDRLIHLYNTKARRRYSMLWLARATNMHAARIHEFLEEKTELHPWEIGSILRMGLFLRIDPLTLLQECIYARAGELTAPLLGPFVVEHRSQNEMVDAFSPHFARLWKVLVAEVFASGVGAAMSFTEQFVAWHYLSFEKVKQAKQSMLLFREKTITVAEKTDVQELALSAADVADLTACWTILWETTLDMQLRDDFIENFLLYWQVYRSVDDFEKLLLESQLRLSDEATRLIPEIHEKERSRLFPELKNRHTQKGQG